MGLIRKFSSVSTLGIINYRSVRQQKAHAMRMRAKAEQEKAKAMRKAARRGIFF